MHIKGAEREGPREEPRGFVDNRAIKRSAVRANNGLVLSGGGEKEGRDYGVYRKREREREKEERERGRMPTPRVRSICRFLFAASRCRLDRLARYG